MTKPAKIGHMGTQHLVFKLFLQNINEFLWHYSIPCLQLLKLVCIFFGNLIKAPGAQWSPTVHSRTEIHTTPKVQ